MESACHEPLVCMIIFRNFNIFKLLFYSKIILGDCHIEHACELFVEEHGKEIVEKNLRMNFILHLCNLQAFGLIRATMVEHLSKKINAIASVGIVKM